MFCIAALLSNGGHLTAILCFPSVRVTFNGFFSAKKKEIKKTERQLYLLVFPQTNYNKYFKFS